LYSQREIGGSPTAACFDSGAPYLDSTLTAVMPRVGRPASATGATPSISSVSATLNPKAPKNKAKNVKIRSLVITASSKNPSDYITPSHAKKYLI